MKKSLLHNNERCQIPALSDIIFYSILNFTKDSVEFVSDQLKTELYQKTNCDASVFTCDQFISLCLHYIPTEEKAALMAVFSRKNALTQYGKGIHDICREVTFCPTRQEKIKAKALMNIERDRFSGAIKGYFYIFESVSLSKRIVKVSQRQDSVNIL